MSPDQDTQDVLAATADGILRHNNFPEALRHYATSLLGWREGPRLVNKISSTHTRSQIVGYLMFLHYETPRNDRLTGPTYMRLLALCERRRDCSPRVLKTVLAMLRLAGLVSVSRSTADRRVKFYRPTAKLIDMMHQWYSQTFGCFDILTANGMNYAQRAGSEPQFLQQVILDIGRPYIEDGILLIRKFPLIYDLFSMDNGFIVCASMVRAHLDGAPAPSPAAIAKAFGSSASQMRNVLRHLNELHLVELSENGKVRDCSALVNLFSQSVARELSLYAKFALGLEEFFVMSPNAAPMSFAAVSFDDRSRRTRINEAG